MFTIIIIIVNNNVFSWQRRRFLPQISQGAERRREGSPFLPSFIYFFFPQTFLTSVPKGVLLLYFTQLLETRMLKLPFFPLPKNMGAPNRLPKCVCGSLAQRPPGCLFVYLFIYLFLYYLFMPRWALWQLEQVQPLPRRWPEIKQQ